MNKIRVSVIPVVALIFVSPASAHHSDAGMDMESVIAFEGTVKEFASASPVSKQMLRKFFFSQLEVDGFRVVYVPNKLQSSGQSGQCGFITKNSPEPLARLT